MADSIGIDARADLLRDEVDEVVLEILGDAGDKRDADRHSQQDADAADELGARVLGVAGCVRVDNVAEDQRIEQREDLVDRRQNQSATTNFRNSADTGRA